MTSIETMCILFEVFFHFLLNITNLFLPFAQSNNVAFILNWLSEFEWYDRKNVFCYFVMIDDNHWTATVATIFVLVKNIFSYKCRILTWVRIERIRRTLSNMYNFELISTLHSFGTIVDHNILGWRQIIYFQFG